MENKKKYVIAAALSLFVIGTNLFFLSVAQEQKEVSAELSSAEVLCYQTKFFDNDFIAQMYGVDKSITDEDLLNHVRTQVNCMELK